MKNLEDDLPRISLNRAQWVRLVVVGIFVVIALGRSVPDLIRVAYPLNVFGYVTDADGVVISVHDEQAVTHAPRHRPARARATPRPPAGGVLEIGDRVRIDRIPAFDRKPGLLGVGFTYDNPDRTLPIVRGGHARTVELRAHSESGPSRFLAVLRIVLFIVSVGLGAILFLIKPGIATAAFFFFCVGGEAPATYLELLLPNPWRQIPGLFGNLLHGASRPALLLFALCLIDGDNDAPRERVFAVGCALLALTLGTIDAAASWLSTYAGRPAAGLERFSVDAFDTVTALTAVPFGIAFARARGDERRRIVWIVAAFLFAGAAQLVSDTFFPRSIPFWLNGALVSATIVPVCAVWFAVIRQRFFNVDFVVSRAIVYVALTAAAVGTISATEEIGTYTFYSNTDLATGFLILISMAVGALTGRLTPLLQRAVDRWIFRDRLDGRRALELIEGYILDAETREDVFRALLADASHALGLSFGGFLARSPDGDYLLSYEHHWPADGITRLRAADELALKLTRTRGAVSFSAKDSALVAHAFPRERLTFAAPVFFDRSLLGVVMYGQNVSGLDLDHEERERLVRVVAHASIALCSIELARCRAGAPVELPLPRGVRTV